MKTNTQAQPNTEASPLTIVGIGASAGGLAALKSFFSLIPPDSGLAYVIVVHLSPEHKSALAELLQPHVRMPVQQVTKTIPLKADHVYVIPPNANLNTIDTHLRLSDLEERRRERAPIDHFFRTLAATHDGNSVGIILTGTGSDGTLGIREIKVQGGLTIVQDPQEAEFDGMPQSAIFSGQVDKVMPLKEIPPFLLKYVSTRPKLKILDPAEEPEGEGRQLIHKIYAQVRARTGRDFSRYKHSTILRRLQRRMQLHQIEHLEDYITLLRKNTEEVHLLSDDFLINVTSFFRDAEVYQNLEDKIIPQIFERKKLDEQVRVWSVGCATGEEAYSLGMLLIEEASRRETAPSIQVFASDLHEHSLKRARDGFYPGDIKVDVSEERLHRFFTKEDGGYRIRKELRELVIFTPHNLLGDPPFSRIDLIVCRNLLIYLQRDVQRDVFELFHYSLRPDGTLVLGSSEHLESTDLFRAENKELSIYAKRNVAGPEPRLPVFPTVHTRFPPEPSGEREQTSLPYGALHQKMVERYGPPSILLSPDYQVMHVSENAGRYLQISGGELSRDGFKLIRPELQMELRSTIYAAREGRTLTRSNPVNITLDGQPHQIILSARVVDESSQENVILVLFEEYDKRSASIETRTTSRDKAPNSEQVKELSRELQDTRQRLQAVIEEYETSREEMKASNEELQSANEELRSTLEELETSKEELQSMNEELTTLNQENRHKVEELGQLSDDLQNLMAATDIATLFLDKKLRILRFTPQLGELFNVRPADRGRLISDQTHQLGYDELISDAQKVLRKLIPIEREVKDRNGNTYLTRVLPYRSAEDRIEGVVITFIDISARIEAEKQLRNSAEQFRALVEASAQMVWTTNAKGEMVEDSSSWRAFTGQTFDECKGFGWLNAVHPEDKKLSESNWQACVKEEKAVNMVARLQHKGGEWRWTTLRAVPLRNEEGSLQGYVGMNTDVTEQKQAEEALLESEERLSQLLEQLPVGVGMLDSNGSWLLQTSLIRELTPHSIPSLNASETFRWKSWAKDGSLVDPSEWPGSRGLRGEVVSPGMEFLYTPEDGPERWIRVSSAPFRDEEGKPKGIIMVTEDITKQKEIAEKLRKSEEHRLLALESSGIGVWQLNPETNELYWSKRVGELLGLAPDIPEDFDMALERVHPEDRSIVLEAVSEATGPEGTGAFEIEYRVVHPDGKLLWISSRAKTLEITGKVGRKTDYLFGAMIDITARKQAEEALRQSEERLRLATASGNMYSWELDMATQEFQYSGSASCVIGLPSEEDLPKSLDEMIRMVHEDDRERTQKELELAQKEAETYSIAFRINSGDNGIIWLEKNARVFRDQQGKAVRIIGIAQNITDRKLAQEALEKAKHEAEIAAQAKDEFLSTMSHEIRTPLNAINGLTSLLLQKHPRRDQQENLNTLKFSAHSLLILINDILDYSKIEAGKVELEHVDYQLSTLVNSIRQAHLPLAEQKDSELYFHIADNVPDVLKGDPHKLAQILNNLISNAIKFTEHGSIYLNVKLEKLEKDAAWLFFEVEDTGIGISEDKIKKIFGKFTQADSSTVRRYGGTGLGLSISKSLLEFMGSEIGVESEEGVGSVFSFSLVQEIGNQAQLKMAEHMYTESNKDAALLRKVKILLVEDAEINRMVVLQHLEEWWGLKADEAMNGKEAVEKARQTQYDLILMDKRMPEMDGVEATLQIRKLNKHYAQIPIIILSADTSMTEEVSEEGSRLFDAMVTKPFEPQQLMKTIISQVVGEGDSLSVSSRKQEARPDKDILAPDFAKVEDHFNDSVKKKKLFYQKALKALQSYQAEYLEGLEQQDKAQLEDSMHKAKTLYTMLGLEPFYEKMLDLRRQVEAGTSAEALKKERDEIRKDLEKLIAKIQQRHEQLG
ncbi:PAS domain S-box-containing protein [Catalinimonas alkaloidigena]|uniref:PAS domain S-box protein n=1 Tax=Catalinimonas alkaloidigena TaxID=1075417 RepID=UPI002404DC2E|nr:PAS domain S-box protein [Catalinimonas alkaloidigena]MDF9799625.1 PAS domain S-box-containing protein [Catalinimonas alkaloidigena]